jgi:hypothetical protein
MRATSLVTLALAALIAMPPLSASGDKTAQQKPTVKIPEPGVSQIMTLEGTYIRAAYNNEGYVILGYKVANQSIGDEWMLLDFGTTVRDGVPNYTMTRDALSLETPDGKTIPLPSDSDVRAANLSALQTRAKVQRDSINYFPPGASQACRVGFFAELDQRAMAYDQVELSSQRACLGWIYFKVPGGIAYGQHWLNVKFEKSLVRVPFRILTKDEEKLLSKNYKDIRKQVQDAFKKKG